MPYRPKALILAAGALCAIGSIAGGAVPPLIEGIDPGLLDGRVRAVWIGDSISNAGTDTDNQSSMPWGAIRHLESQGRLGGVVLPVNGNQPYHGVTFAGQAAALVQVVPMTSGNRTFFSGHSQFAIGPTYECMFFAPTDGRIAYGVRVFGDAWSFDDGQSLACSFIHLGTPTRVECDLVSYRQAPDPNDDEIYIVDGGAPVPEGVAIQSLTPTALPPGDGLVEFTVTLDGAHVDDGLIVLGTRIWTDTDRIQVSSMAVGGARTADWLNGGPFASDTHMAEYLSAIGVNDAGSETVFFIQLGANDGLPSPAWAADAQGVVDRFRALAPAAYVVLVPPYGTRNSIKFTHAMGMAQVLYDIAANDANVGFINLPALWGGAIPDDLLIDYIHPRPAGADACAALVLNAADDNPHHPADIDDFPGVLDAGDFFAYLDRYAANLPSADLTGSVDAISTLYGAPDGIVDSADFFFYLDLFAIPYR